MPYVEGWPIGVYNTIYNAADAMGCSIKSAWYYTTPCAHERADKRKNGGLLIMKVKLDERENDDDQRRAPRGGGEVARYCRKDFWHTSRHEMHAIRNAYGCYTGKDQQDVELKDRLADLIEQEDRTCTIKKRESKYVLSGWWECSECGGIVYPPCNEEIALWALQYCPHCCAKVVEE